jgi:hypothetical protein
MDVDVLEALTENLQLLTDSGVVIEDILRIKDKRYAVHAQGIVHAQHSLFLRWDGEISIQREERIQSTQVAVPPSRRSISAIVQRACEVLRGISETSNRVMQELLYEMICSLENEMKKKR